MKPVVPQDWQPDPQLLAAYFDGELDERADLADLHSRVEAWLAQHPEVVAEEQAQQRRMRIWQETTPPEPGNATWNHLLARIDEARRQPQPLPRKNKWLKLGAIAIVLVFGVLGVALKIAQVSREPDPLVVVHAQPNPPDGDLTPFPVATVGEVVILRVEGEDTGALVVGELPLHGPLELADPGDIRFVRVQPDSRDNMLPHVRQGDQSRPIIWARIETEEE